MKHALRLHEAKRVFVLNVPKARFIAAGDFILHTPIGALHSAKTKRAQKCSLCFGGEGGIHCSFTRLAAPLRCAIAAPFAIPWRSERVPDSSSLALRIPSKSKTKRVRLYPFCFWRRRWDSNPRTVLSVTRFPIVRPRPAKRLLHINVNLFASRAWLLYHSNSRLSTTNFERKWVSRRKILII